MQEKTIQGFSKLSKEEKVDWVVNTYFEPSENSRQRAKEELRQFWLEDGNLQHIFDHFSENTLSNFFLPFGVAPNFLINGKVYALPMVIEESSVVAAAASASKFWLDRGGFKTEVISTKKLGQVHFTWKGPAEKLISHFDIIREVLLVDAAYLTRNMEQRGGGVVDISLRDLTALEPGYFQLFVTFETCDSMGANFINSILEQFGQSLKAFVSGHPGFVGEERSVEIIMAILSNYTPECVVRASVECSTEVMAGACEEMNGPEFSEKFKKAVRIAHIDPYRATTHNKGIYNGVDAVVIATGNDFRAVEACGHTYASREGQYKSLSYCTVEEGTFKFWIDLPLALGTVGGLTRLHPLAKRSLELLGNPGAEELMGIIAVAGLAQNFAALRSLITTGIQRGHMKMHLANILNHLSASPEATIAALAFFEQNPVSVASVRNFLEEFEIKR